MNSCGCPLEISSTCFPNIVMVSSILHSLSCALKSHTFTNKTKYFSIALSTWCLVFEHFEIVLFAYRKEISSINIIGDNKKTYFSCLIYVYGAYKHMN